MLERRIQEARQQDDQIACEIFEKERLFDCDLSHMNFRSVQFVSCGFAHCDFSHVSFDRVKFVGCDFSGCTFSESYWKSSQIQECKGDKARFTGSYFRESLLSGSSFCYGDFSQCAWQESVILRCMMKEGIFTENQLKKLKLRQVNLNRADFFRTPLNGMDLSDCSIAQLMVSDGFAELKGAKISAAQAVDLVPLLGVKII